LHFVALVNPTNNGGNMLSKQSAELLKGVTGATDEQLAKLHSGEEKLFNKWPHTAVAKKSPNFVKRIPQHI